MDFLVWKTVKANNTSKTSVRPAGVCQLCSPAMIRSSPWCSGKMATKIRENKRSNTFLEKSWIFKLSFALIVWFNAWKIKISRFSCKYNLLCKTLWVILLKCVHTYPCHYINQLASRNVIFINFLKLFYDLRNILVKKSNIRIQQKGLNLHYEIYIFYIKRCLRYQSKFKDSKSLQPNLAMNFQRV